MEDKDNDDLTLELELESEAGEKPTPPKGEVKRPDPEADNEADILDDPDDQDNDPEFREYLEKYGKKANKRIRKLVNARKDAEAARTQAFQRLSELEAQLETTRAASTQLQSISVKEAEGRLKAEEASARKAIEEALTEGDPSKAAEAYTRLARVVAETENLKFYKPVERKETETAPRPQPQQVRQAQPPEATPRTKQWLRDNPWFRENQALQQAATVIHQQVVLDGYDPRDDEDSYFEELDRRISETLQIKPKAAAPRTTTLKMPSSMGSGGAGTKPRVTLTREEMATAERMLLGLPGVDSKEAAYKLYAAEKHKKGISA